MEDEISAKCKIFLLVNKILSFNGLKEKEIKELLIEYFNVIDKMKTSIKELNIKQSTTTNSIFQENKLIKNDILYLSNKMNVTISYFNTKRNIEFKDGINTQRCENKSIDALSKDSKTFSKTSSVQNKQQISNIKIVKSNLKEENGESLKIYNNLFNIEPISTLNYKTLISEYEKTYIEEFKQTESKIKSNKSLELKKKFKSLIIELKNIIRNLLFIKEKLENNKNNLEEVNKILSKELQDIEKLKNKEIFCLHCHKTFILKSLDREEVRFF